MGILEMMGTPAGAMQVSRMFPMQQQQGQQQQQPAINPMLLQQFTGGQGAAGGNSGLMAGGGLWAALAAAIAANETWANQEGRRPDSFKDHATDMLTGKVLEYDADKLADNKYIDAVPGLSGLTKLGGKLGNPEGLYEVGATGFKNLFGGLF